jgi:hypothetical protein
LFLNAPCCSSYFTVSLYHFSSLKLSVNLMPSLRTKARTLFTPKMKKPFQLEQACSGVPQNELRSAFAELFEVTSGVAPWIRINDCCGLDTQNATIIASNKNRTTLKSIEYLLMDITDILQSIKADRTNDNINRPEIKAVGQALSVLVRKLKESDNYDDIWQDVQDVRNDIIALQQELNKAVEATSALSVPNQSFQMYESAKLSTFVASFDVSRLRIL